MQATKENNLEVSQRLTVPAEELAKMLSCGRRTAVDIGKAANARVQFGRRVLFNVEKVKSYIATLEG